MTDEQLSHDIAMGESAKAVLENEAFTTAFEALTQELTNKWQNSPVKDEAGREKCYQMLTAARAMKVNLESLILSGKMAQEKRQTLLERAKSSLPAWMSGSE